MLGNFKVAGTILNNLNKSYTASDLAMQKISSGNRINSAADDAAGLAISEKLLSQMNGLNMAAKNTQDGISLINTAEGAMNEIHAIAQSMREKAVQAANDTNAPEEREALNNQIQQYIQEINRIASNTDFNTKKLLNGDHKEKAIKLQIGANSGQHMDIFIGNMSWESLLGKHAGSSDLNLLTQGNADKMIGVLDGVLKNVSSERSTMGAYTNRLEHAYNVTLNTGENLTTAYAQIKDVDIAKEIMNLTKENLKQQVATSVLSMHMQSASNVLNLLRQKDTPYTIRV